MLKETVSAFRETLKVWTRENALHIWAVLTRDAEWLVQARKHVSNALVVFSSAGASYYEENAKKLLALIDQGLPEN